MQNLTIRANVVDVDGMVEHQALHCCHFQSYCCRNYPIIPHNSIIVTSLVKATFADEMCK